MVHQDTSNHRRARKHHLRNLHSNKIDQNNVGYKLLCNMDWKHGEGIGKLKNGQVDYVKVSRNAYTISTYTDIEGNKGSVSAIGGHGIGYSNKNDDDYSIVDESLVRTSIFSGMLADLQKQANTNGGFIFFNKKKTEDISNESDSSDSSDESKNKKKIKTKPDKKSRKSTSDSSENEDNNECDKKKFYISQHKHSKITNAKVGINYSVQDLSGIFHQEKKRKRKESLEKEPKSKKSKLTDMVVHPIAIGDYFKTKAMEQKKIVY